MKKLFLTFGIALFGFTLASAQDSDIMHEEETATEVGTEAEMVEEDLEGALSEKEVVAEDEIPSAVKDAVSTGAYEAMEIKEIYRVAAVPGDEQISYEIHLEGEVVGESTVVTVRESGEIIKSDNQFEDQ